MYVSGHSGVEYVLSLNKEKFWIISTRTAVQRHLNTHIACKRRQAHISEHDVYSLKPLTTNHLFLFRYSQLFTPGVFAKEDIYSR